MRARAGRALRAERVHTGSAFLVESMVLMAFLVASLAVFAVLFLGAWRIADASARQSLAISAARNRAEEFAADPAGAAVADAVLDGSSLRLSCAVTSEPQEAGTLYRAVITVRDEAGAEVYSLGTARYVGGAQ